MTREVSDEEWNRICQELDRARETKGVDTSKMTLTEKIEHQRAIKAARESARGRE